LAEYSSFGATAHDDAQTLHSNGRYARKNCKNLQRYAMGSTAAQTLSEADRAVAEGAEPARKGYKLQVPAF